MDGPTFWDLSIFIAPVLLPLLFGLLVWLWFVIGRARDVRYQNRMSDGRCWKCNYELCGITSDRCPECGMVIARPWHSRLP
jgi:hypothetical protein